MDDFGRLDLRFTNYDLRMIYFIFFLNLKSASMYYQIQQKLFKFFVLLLGLTAAPFFASAATTSVVIGGGQATLSMSPSSGSYNAGDIFSVNIFLNTGGSEIQGVDIMYLNYNPALLEAQDDDDAVAGAQITAGSLMPSTLTNTVDNATGKITFSQVTDSGVNYTGNGVLAAIHFKALSAGTANVTFDFTTGSTIDTNVASAGNDILLSIGNGSYAIVVPQNTNTTNTTNNTTNITTTNTGVNTTNNTTPIATVATTTITTTFSTTTIAAFSQNYSNGALLKGDNQEIFVVLNNERRWIPSIEIFNSYGYKWEDIKTITQSELNFLSRGADLSMPASVQQASQSPASPFLPVGVSEGDLVRGPDGIKVYIVNYYGYRRHIFNPAIFNMYGHFRWDKIKTLDQKTIDSLPTSDFYKAEGDPKVFSLKEIDEKKGLAQKRWFDFSGEKFTQLGFKWDQVFTINTKERDYYQEGVAITEQELTQKPVQSPKIIVKSVGIVARSLVKTEDNPTIYYITNSGMKKPILNATVFNSYKDNKWENIKTVTQVQLDAYSVVRAIKFQGDNAKVYLLDFPNKQKRLIKNSAAMTRLGIASDKVAPVNQTELDAYADGAAEE